MSVPGDVTNLVAVSGPPGTDYADLTWTAPTDFGGTFEAYEVTLPSKVVVDVTTTGYRVHGLSPGVQSIVLVQVKNTTNELSGGNAIFATGPDAGSPPDFDVSCTINGLDVSTSPYELQAESRAQRDQQWRKITATNAFVEGEYDVQAVRGNVTETLAVYVRANDHGALRTAINALLDTVQTPSYPVVWRSQNVTETWDATFAEYSLETQAEFNWATMALVRLSIPRRPRVRYDFGGGVVVTR